MAIAGTVSFVPKGEYNSQTTYKRLNTVRYQNKVYVSLKTVVGVTPSDDKVNWMLFVDTTEIAPSDIAPEFSVAATRENIMTGESLPTLFGKIKKYFTDLKGHAFNDTVNNLTTSTTGSALDASQGNVLQGEVDEINSNLDTLQFGELAGGKNLIFEEIYGYLSTATNIHIDNASTSYVFYANKGKHYTFSSPIEPTANGGIRVGNIQNKVPKDSEVVQDYQVLADKSFIANKTGYYFVYVYNSKVENVDVQIEEGTQATEYEPYFPSNKMLAKEKADKTETTVNLLNPTLQTVTRNGVTCTNNGDGTYTLNGTADSSSPATFILKGEFNCSQFIGMKLVGCPSGAIVDGVRKFILVMEGTSSPWTSHADDIGEGSVIVGPSENINLFIRVYEGATVNNIVFKPMLTTNLDATYDDFVPYTGDTGKLNSDVAALLKRIETLESLVNKTDTTVTE